MAVGNRNASEVSWENRGVPLPRWIAGGQLGTWNLMETKILGEFSEKRPYYKESMHPILQGAPVRELLVSWSTEEGQLWGYIK